MDATLMISAPATPAPVTPAPSTVSSGGTAQNTSKVELPGDSDRASTTPNGRVFAGLMRGLLPTHERQDVAAATDTATTEPGDLKTEVLGDQLNVITTSNALPDPSSLSAFARAQGLDEAAVKALFGDIAAQKQLKTDAAVPLTELATPAAIGDVGWLATQLSAEISLQVSPLKTTPTTAASSAALLPADSATLTGDAVLSSVMDWRMMASALPLMSSAVSVAGKPPNPENTLSVTLPNALSMTMSGAPGWGSLGLNAPLSAPTALSPLGILPLTQTPSAGLTTAAGLPGTGLAGGVLANSLASAALLPGTSAEASKPSLSTPIEATDALSLLTPASPAPEDAMRIRLVPAWAVVTQQLTQMSGTTLSATWGALTAASLAGPTRSVDLDLSTALPVDGEESSATDGGWSSPTLELNRPGAANALMPGAVPVPRMAQTLRQEHYQQLADRLGQAMAERLQSQIARGEWKLQMRLNPASLGRIDVELDMHAKGLDAVFRSDNPLTRELMVQSMPKLKDTLSQSGMAVASVWVNSDAGRQSDGNPTPQKDRTDVKDTPTSAQADVGPTPAAKIQSSSDGFDVLA